MSDPKFNEDSKLKVRKWADDNVWWIVGLIGLATVSLMACTAGSLLYGIQGELMGVAAVLAIFCSLIFIMIIRRCVLQGKIEEEPTIIQMAQEEALDGPPLFPHYQRRRSSIATIPRCSIPNMDMIIDNVRRQSIHGGQRKDSVIPVSSSGTASICGSGGTSQSSSGRKDTLILAPIAELPKTPTMEHVSHGTSLPK